MAHKRPPSQHLYAEMEANVLKFYGAFTRRNVSPPMSHIFLLSWKSGSVNSFTLWFVDSGMNEISQQWRRPQQQPPGASYSCTSCCPTGCRPHGAAGHRPASEQSYRPGNCPPHECGGGSPGSASQWPCWCGCESSAHWENRSKSAFTLCHPPPSWRPLSASWNGVPPPLP